MMAGISGIRSPLHSQVLSHKGTRQLKVLFPNALVLTLPGRPLFRRTFIAMS